MLFKDHYQNAPKKIQEIVDSFETSETLAQIAADHTIDNNKGIGNRDLGRLTGQVLVGMLHPKDFVPSLVEKLDIAKEKAQEIAKEVNQKIFSQVKDLLIEIHGLKKDESSPRIPLSDIKENSTHKKGSSEISVPQKPIAPETETELKKENSKTTRENPIPTLPKAGIPPVPQVPVKQKDDESVKNPLPTPQAPQIPQKKGGGVKTSLANPLPRVSQNLHQSTTQESSINSTNGADKFPTPKKEGPSSENTSQKLKNPFEEKLKQIFTIPSKGPILKPPFKKEAGKEDIEKEIKKASVTKDPYLETPD